MNMKYLLLCLVALIANIVFCGLSIAEEYRNSDFSIQIPGAWQAVERDKEGESRSWLFGKQATEEESGVSVAIYIQDVGDIKFNSEDDLNLTTDRLLNKHLHIMGKNKQVLNTSIIYDEIIDEKKYRAANFRSLINVSNHPELEFEIYGRVYLAVIDSKVITINFQASKDRENETKPELEKVVESIRLFKE